MKATWVVIIYLGLVAAINFLPTLSEAPLDPEFASGLQSIYAAALAWDSIFPISWFFYCVFLGVAYEGLILLWKGLRWALGFARGGGDA